jgi:FkbM family methyltransferase
MYSQNNEEQIILNYFGSATGRLLEIGAYDGISFSNSYQLLLNGWEGVMVEASPTVFESLERNLSGLQVQLLNECITLTDEAEITFYDNQGAVATTSAAHVQKWQQQEKFTPITVKPMSLASLLDKVGTDFAMVNIDVEGQSADLFYAAFDAMPDVQLWVVEHDNQIDQITAHAVGYKMLLHNGENLILAK